MIKLSEEQKQIVKYDINTCIRVLASAGSGKTRVLTERVRYVLSQTNNSGILALTFTNKAAKEMKTRLENSNSSTENCWISTIHSVAQRIIDQYGYTISLPSDLNIYDREQDRRSIFSQSLDNMGVPLKFDEQREYMYKFSQIKRKLLTDNEIKERYQNQMLSIFKNYQEELKKAGGIDFDDILVYAHRILIEQPWCAKIYGTKYKYIFVDEAQDLNKAQYELIKALSAGGTKSIMMVGDSNQMIYGFNGSSIDYLCKFFKKDFSSNFKSFELKTNYRSSKKVIRLANCLKPNSQKESQLAIYGKSRFKDFGNENKEAKWIVKKIQNILQKQTDNDIEGDISLNNIVVIARNRFVFHNLEKVLEENKIAFTLKATKPVLDPISDLGKIFDLAIRLKINPQDWMSEKKLYELLVLNFDNKNNTSSDVLKVVVNSIINSSGPLIKLKKDILKRIIELDTENPNILKLFEDTKRDITHIERKITSNNNSDTINTQTHELDIFMQDLAEFKECWNSFRREKSGSSLLAFKKAISLGELVVNHTHWVVDEPKLTLSTVHTMKGLEKDIVFLMGMCEGIFPDYRATTQSAIEEEKNNAFVAITRAKRWIYITWSKQLQTQFGNTRLVEPSQFINLMKKTSLNTGIKNQALSS